MGDDSTGVLSERPQGATFGIFLACFNVRLTRATEDRNDHILEY